MTEILYSVYIIYTCCMLYTRGSLRWPKKSSKEMFRSRFLLVDFFSINQNREDNISFEDFLGHLRDPRV